MSSETAFAGADWEAGSEIARPESELWRSHVKVGMLAFLLSEVAFFSTLITTYVVYLRQTKESSPSPAEVFHWPVVLVGTACLLSSSVTIHFADAALKQGNRFKFLFLWGLTILLGVVFLGCTGKEWHELIETYGLTISRNLFGSTYFTLVGFHALHVTVGLILLSTIFLLGCRREVLEHCRTGAEVISWYWHFVDGVWIAVFTLVYLIGR
jgi:cytochrome c oxidase subunit 3/cytochrome o ubiquinol oxidase subunit 3